jgi:putative transposase
LNNIELEWQQLKTYELARQMFEDEIDLAYTVIDGIEARGQRGNHTIQRFKFNFPSSS